jgi:sugar/nucleoside kinase (ribokinase family)
MDLFAGGRWLRVLVAGFITIDEIEIKTVSRTVCSIGGPPCYAGLVCARHGADVYVITKVGNDFPDEQTLWLARNGIQLLSKHRSLERKTTRFNIKIFNDRRELTLVSKCSEPEEDQLEKTDFDASIVSPVAGEIGEKILGKISKKSSFLFLDPQGFLRTFDSKGKAILKHPSKDSFIQNATAIKVDREEAVALTGKESYEDIFSFFRSRGVKKGIITNAAEPCFVLDGNRIYKVQVPKVRVVDTTGAGEILCGAVTTCYMKSRDFLWSACFGIASSSLSLNLLALSKVDLPMGVEDIARKIYSSASYVGSL